MIRSARPLRGRVAAAAWLLVPLVTACALAGARAREDAQDANGAEAPPAAGLSEYPYLPHRYGEAFIPSVAEWQAMRLTALGASTTRITEQFSRQHLTCFPTRKGLVMTLDLLPEPGWNGYSGGKFTAPVETVKPDLQKAVDASMKFTRSFFSEVRDQDVSIRIFIRSQSAGVWENGTLTLTAPAKP